MSFSSNHCLGNPFGLWNLVYTKKDDILKLLFPLHQVDPNIYDILTGVYTSEADIELVGLKLFLFSQVMDKNKKVYAYERKHLFSNIGH